MSDELKQRADQLISYYHQHGVADMIKNHPGFVEDDFTNLLTLLEQELNND